MTHPRGHRFLRLGYSNQKVDTYTPMFQLYTACVLSTFLWLGTLLIRTIVHQIVG